MRAVTAKQMQRIDRDAIQKYGIPSIVLMENAGRGASEIIIGDASLFLKKNGRENRLSSPNIVIVCGPGNNGGDGFVVARHLLIHGIKPKIFVLVSEDKLRGDAAINCQILQKFREAVRFSLPTVGALKHADIVVDAIFGIGLKRAITGKFKTAIDRINRYAQKVISLDIPSGLDADNGNVHGVCVKASQTITFHLPKKGMLVKDGLKYCSNYIVVHIGCKSRDVSV